MGAALSEAALAEVAYGMRVASSAEKHIDQVEAALRRCKVSVESDSFKHIRYYLDKMHADLAQAALRHVDAVDGQ